MGKLDRSAFAMGSAQDAHHQSRGSELSPEERIAWSRRAALQSLGLDPDIPHPMDRTFYRERQHANR
jgi:hypothetical protein